jgi:hypothetical protein
MNPWTGSGGDVIGTLTTPSAEAAKATPERLAIAKRGIREVKSAFAVGLNEVEQSMLTGIFSCHEARPRARRDRGNCRLQGTMRAVTQ